MSRRVLLGVVGAFLLGAALVYGASLRNGFVNFDDGLLIYDNPIVRELSFSSLKRAFTTYDPELYIPLTFLSYQLNHAVHGLEPFGYHAVNVLLHAGNALLLSWIAWLLTKRKVAALIAGALFLAHPLHVEAVAWAAARKDLLSAFFFLLSLGSHLKSRENGSDRWYWAGVLFFLLALLSKVVAITLPVAVLLIDWSRGRKLLPKRALGELAPHLVLCAVFAVVAVFGKVGSGSFLLEKILIGCKAIVFYLGKLAWPSGLSVLYPYTKPIALSTPDLLLSVVVVLAITGAALALLRRSRVPLGAWAFFVILLLPTFGNIAKGQEHFRDVYFASDRYAYLASMSVFLLAGILVDRLRGRFGRPVEIGAACAVVVLGVLSFRQSLVWADTETLFRHVLEHYPNAQLAHNYVGTALYEKGDLEGALRKYEDSLAVRPNDLGFFNKGVVLEKLGRIGEAMEAYGGAIAINPISIDARINLGALLLRAERYGEAATLFKEAIASAPAFTGVRDVTPLLALAHFNLGVASEALGRTGEAVEAYRKALELDPSDAEAAEKIRTLTEGR